MKTSVYVDGFNLYYGAVRGTPYKWLNVDALCRVMLPKHDVTCIKYFTARVSARPDDPSQPTRQQAFLRALRTIPHLEIIYGHFLTSTPYMPLADSAPNLRYARVIKTEEKGSDVNIATHMLWDGFRDRYEAAVVVSNDSDLVGPVKIVKEEIGRVVGVLSPYRKASRHLAREATFIKSIRDSALAKSQFPETLRDVHGTITKPSNW